MGWLRTVKQAVTQVQARRAQSRLEKLVMRNGGSWFPNDRDGALRPGMLVIGRADLLADADYRRGPDHFGQHPADAFCGAVLDGGRAQASTPDWGNELDHRRGNR